MRAVNVRYAIAKAALREFVDYDLGILRQPAGASLLAAARLLRMTSRQAQGFDLLIRAHHPAFSPGIDRRIVDEIARCTALERSDKRTGLWDFYEQIVRTAVSTFRATGADPRRFVGSRILVVKRAAPRERGVLMVDYTYVFPLLAGLFDLKAIADRYFIVLEPSWSDCCTPEILQFTRLDSPVLVQSVEPRDSVLFGALRSNCSQGTDGAKLVG